MSDFKWRDSQGEVILWAVRWYCRSGISYRDLEQMTGERGVAVDHSTIYRWVQRYAPEIEKRLRWHWRRPGRNFQSDKRRPWRSPHRRTSLWHRAECTDGGRSLARPELRGAGRVTTDSRRSSQLHRIFATEPYAFRRRRQSADLDGGR